MRVLRATGENISPSDDASLFEQMFSDGLFEEATISSLGSNQVSISALYGILCGREFTNSAQTINVALPTGSDTTGYIYVQYDLAADPIGTIESALAPFTPTVEDINSTGSIAQYVLATYTASAVAVTSITPVYDIAHVHGSRYEADITLTASAWSSALYTITDSHIDPDKLNILTYDSSLTDAQYEAYVSAQIRPYGTETAGQMTLKAVGGAPTINLPLVLIVRE